MGRPSERVPNPVAGSGQEAPDPVLLVARSGWIFVESCQKGLYRRFSTLFDREIAVVTVVATANVISEQTNELLLKNHDLRLVGLKALPIANASFNKSTNRIKGRERKQWHNPCRGSERLNHPKQLNLSPNHGKGKQPVKKHDEHIYHHYGMVGHWSHTYHMPKHFANIYQAP
ncbi:Uncharacterized protein TCM_012904 [Theobroma cacao]|uniref:Uncharacterized protein n=1 Tax=Theobroma cacao TaxID=3641 RepID=A0A061FWD2_THECC|nr:Uncharacterized protein TCM_012904 [Theobroma cacao]